MRELDPNLPARTFRKSENNRGVRARAPSSPGFDTAEAIEQAEPIRRRFHEVEFAYSILCRKAENGDLDQADRKHAMIIARAHITRSKGRIEFKFDEQFAFDGPQRHLCWTPDNDTWMTESHTIVICSSQRNRTPDTGIQKP
ncbi:hypothetical protein [Methylosinus trichosporium]|uniref:hypothetical protein n=1 Tax=Methylosinus trichosporium TaxID=426 RepID=UPI001FCF0917|nr:hypothetical protein [Methylosinus trichosporium]